MFWQLAKVIWYEIYPLVISKYGVLPTEQQLDVIKNEIIENEVNICV